MGPCHIEPGDNNAEWVQVIGHMDDDDHSACGVLTRAKKVLWVVGGPLKGNLADIKQERFFFFFGKYLEQRLWSLILAV